MTAQKIRLFITVLLTSLYAGAAMYSLMGVAPAMKQMQPPHNGCKYVING